jgi:hypothetical protein
MSTHAKQPYIAKKCDFNVFLWIFKDSYGFECISKDSYGFRTKNMGDLFFPSASVGSCLYAVPWWQLRNDTTHCNIVWKRYTITHIAIYTNIQAYMHTCVYVHGFQCNSKDSYVFLRTPMDSYVFLRIPMYF